MGSKSGEVKTYFTTLAPPHGPKSQRGDQRRSKIEKLIEDEVKSGRSTDPNEFINRAVYHYVVERDLGEEYTPEEIDRMIADGLDDIDRGGIRL